MRAFFFLFFGSEVRVSEYTTKGKIILIHNQSYTNISITVVLCLNYIIVPLAYILFLGNVVHVEGPQIAIIKIPLNLAMYLKIIIVNERYHLL